MNQIKNTKSIANIPEIMWNNRTKKNLSDWKQALQMAENPLNPTRYALMELYADAILDPHLASVLSKRILAVTNTKLVFSEDENEDEKVKEIIESIEFEKILIEILNAKFYGYSLIQSDFNTPKTDLIDRRYVKPEKCIVVKQYMDEIGENYTENGYQNTCCGVGSINDLGLLLIASQYVILKKGNIMDWATFNERYATPFRYTTLPVGAGQSEISDSKKQLAEMGANGYGVFPQGSEMKFVEAKSSGNNTNYENFSDFCNAEISKLFLGQTMTTEDGSSMSQAVVHKGVEDKISRADKKFVEKVLNTQVRQLMISQGIISENSKAKFKFRDEDEEMSLQEQSAIWLSANAIAPIDKEEFSNRFGVKFSGEKPEIVEENPVEEKKKSEKKELKLVDSILAKLGFFQ
jgi:phage gp29-like protein